MRYAIKSALVLILLAGCSGNNEMYLLKPAQSAAALPNKLGRVEVMQVALPDYAVASEITIQDKEGVLRAQSKKLWADKPVNAITQMIADQIAAQSKATAIVEPWPLSEPADRRLEVRISQIYAGNDGQFHLRGQYFVAPTGGQGADIMRRFDLSVPLADDGLAAVAQAELQALQDLARNIAQLK